MKKKKYLKDNKREWFEIISLMILGILLASPNSSEFKTNHMEQTIKNR